MAALAASTGTIELAWRKSAMKTQAKTRREPEAMRIRFIVEPPNFNSERFGRCATGSTGPSALSIAASSHDANPDTKMDAQLRLPGFAGRWVLSRRVLNHEHALSWDRRRLACTERKARKTSDAGETP